MGIILNSLGKYQQDSTALHEHISAANLLANAIVQVKHGYSTVHAEMDFETYSEAGHVFDDEAGRFRGLGANKKGLSAVGAAVYAQHPSTEVLCLAYNLKDGLGPRLWMAGSPPPWDLFAHIQSGKLIEAHNSIFEYFIWHYVCHLRMGWPALSHMQLRCSMSKAAAFALPMSLDKLSAALNAPIKKDKEGAAVMLKLVQPRTPTKNNPSLRLTPASSPDAFKRLGQYCVNDINAESEVSAMLPDLQPDELELWLLDQQINIRGVHIDKASLENCINIVEQAFDKYSEELKNLCGGYHDAAGTWQWNVSSPAELQNIRVYLAAKGVQTPSLDAEHLALLLKQDNLPPDCRRVLEIRDMLSASSVKKLFSLLNHLGPDDRVRGLFAFCGADRTGRFAGRGPQPQNMPSSGPKLNRCDKINGCGHYFQKKLTHCPWCKADASFSEADKEWTPEAVDQALTVIASRNLHYVEHYFGDAIAVISGCLRGLFCAAPGKDFICSDFSAIEAVVLAELAGEQWRQEVFRTHGKIYEMGAAKITGEPFEEFMKVAGYPDITKEGWWEDEPLPGAKHHHLRKTIGKVSELACLAGDTEVLTERGYVNLIDIRTTDKVWDGISWINHGGVVFKGEKEVINFDGVMVTRDHKILSNHTYTDDGSTYSWTEAGDFFNKEDVKAAAYEVGGFYLPGNASLRKMPVYDVLECGPHSRFTIRTNRGHLLVHNSGYAGWIGAWKNFGADKFMTDDEIKKAILVWREASPMIVELWGGQWRKHPTKWEFTPEFYGLEGAAVQAVLNPGQAYAYRSLTYVVNDDVLYCRLLSGRLLSYHEPRLIQGSAPHGNPVWQLTYMGQDEVGRWVRLNTYGGKLVENCLVGSSRVLTDSGWKRLDSITGADLVHDGLEFVNHGGITYKSIQACVKVDGVSMTHDHKVLTNYGWKTASQRPRPYRPSIRNANVYGIKPLGWKEKSLALPMRLWEILRESWRGYDLRNKAGWDSELRMLYKEADRRGESPTWDDTTPSVRGLEVHDRSLQIANPPSLAQLWGTWNYCVRKVATKVREFLGGHGWYIPIRLGVRSQGQRSGVLTTKLQMGDARGGLQQSKNQCAGGYDLRTTDLQTNKKPIRYKPHHYLREIKNWLAQRRFVNANVFCTKEAAETIGEFPVYDILNCGPRNRFVVRGDQGPFIVHNCTQAVARDILTYSMKNLEKAGYHIVLHIHDEIVAEVDKGWGSIEEFERIMAIMPPWASDWPIRAAGGWRGLRYRKG